MLKFRPPANVRRAPSVRRGSVQRSKRVIRRSRAAASFVGSIEVHAAAAAAAFGERFAAELRAGETAPDHALALAIVGRAVMTALEDLEAAEDEYCGLGVLRVRMQRECQEIARKELNPRIVDLRREIEAAHGPKVGALIHGLKGKTRRKPAGLQAQGRELVTTLEGELSKTSIADKLASRAELEGWLRRVQPPYQRLVAKSKEVESLKRKEEYACLVRDGALEEFDEIHRQAAAYAGSLYRLVGFSERVIGYLRPIFERHRLARAARRERQARAEGRRPRPGARVRAAFSNAAHWLRHFRSRVA